MLSCIILSCLFLSCLVLSCRQWNCQWYCVAWMKAILFANKIIKLSWLSWLDRDVIYLTQFLLSQTSIFMMVSHPLSPFLCRFYDEFVRLHKFKRNDSRLNFGHLGSWQNVPIGNFNTRQLACNQACNALRFICVQIVRHVSLEMQLPTKRIASVKLALVRNFLYAG